VKKLDVLTITTLVAAVIFGVLLLVHIVLLASPPETSASAMDSYRQQLMLLFAGELVAGCTLITAAFKSIQRSAELASSLQSAWQLIQNQLKRKGDGKPVSSEQMKQSLNELCSELSEHRRTARELFDRAVDVICVVNTSGEIQTVNKACQSAWGYSPSELEGKPVQSLFEKDEADRIMPNILGAALSIDKIVFESRICRKDGALVDVIWTGHWSVREQGLYCIVHDVSQQKQLERTKQEFVAMVTHDIRGPLATIEAMLGLMEVGVLGQINDKGQRIAQGTRKQCQHLLRLLNDMLQLDKMEAGSFDLVCEQMDVANVAQDAVENVRHLTEAKHLTVNQQVQHINCWADELRVIQVILNLLTNAIKYSPENSTIDVKVEDRGSFAYVAVTDRGRGIPPEKTSRIFEKFEQVSSSDARDKQGTGLGLAICKGIVTQHGGEIGVQSVLEQGSTFWFTIPKAPVTATVSAPNAAGIV
jgi:PAS domain S-box-containing protein